MKREMMKVVDGRPPNYDAILAVLPDAANPGVMFCYGDTVYFPGGKGPLTRELDAHERVHADRQLAYEGGPSAWWVEYLANDAFRYTEELLAHREEFSTYCARHINPIKRHQALTRMAKRLASGLYAAGVTEFMATYGILYGANPYEPT
jgi:hypothetical protein